MFDGESKLTKIFQKGYFEHILVEFDFPSNITVKRQNELSYNKLAV
jgi:hypothetical protein